MELGERNREERERIGRERTRDEYLLPRANYL